MCLCKGNSMKRKQLIAVSILSICLFTSACGSNTSSSDEVETLKSEIAELQQELEEAKQGQSAENTTDLANNLYDFDAETQELIEYTAENAEYQGVCGADAKWYYKDNVLVIRGTGEITDNPWHNASYDMLDINWVFIDEGITSLLCSYAFSAYDSAYNSKIVCNNCYNLSKIILPSTLIEIGEDAFEGCLNLKNITIPDSVTIIRDNAFRNCDSLDESTIEKIESINVNGISKAGLVETP